MSPIQKNKNILPTKLSPKMVPEKELVLFKPFLKTYKKGEALIIEGDYDKKLFLLRKGTVGVYRQLEGDEKLITFIGAVNFIGEMEFFTESARIATVRAYSDEIVVYSFTNPDLVTMLCNKEWGMKLLLRLSSDLKMFSDKTIELESEIKLLHKKLTEAQELIQQ